MAPRINGYVTEVLVKDNQWVRWASRCCIDPRTYRATLDQAEAVIAVREADIAAATAGVQGQQSSLLQARTQLTAATASLRFARSELAVSPLAASGADTHEHVESLRHDVERTQAQYDAARAQIQGVQSQIDASQAQLEQAQAGLKQAQADAAQARVAFEDTELRARIDGRIGNKTVQVGQFVAAGTRTMTVVPVASLYLSANFKETQVGLMRAGQPAEIRSMPCRVPPCTVRSRAFARHRIAVRAAAAAECHRQLHQGGAAGAGAHPGRCRCRSAQGAGAGHVGGSDRGHPQRQDARRRTRDEAEATAAPVR